MPDLPSAAILLATYNGDAFLESQIASIERQQGVGRIDVLVSDDGSGDRTRELLSEWSKRWTRGSFEILVGPGQGFAANFRSLMLRSSTAAAYYAFCDQDDVWEVDKLAVAITALEAATKPALYLSRTRIIDEHGQPIGYSPLFRRQPSFENALVQSIGGGNTVVLNKAGFELVKESVGRSDFVSHDWWCYLIVSGAGGLVVYDPEPHVGYRQHGGNLVGQNAGLRASALRIQQLLEGRFSRWIDTNLRGLAACRDLLTPEAAMACEQLAELRRKRGLSALRALSRLGLYRQTARGNFSLCVASIIGKL